MYSIEDTPLFHIKHRKRPDHIAHTGRFLWACHQPQCDGEHHYWQPIPHPSQALA